MKCPHHNGDIFGSPFKLHGLSWLTPNHQPWFYVAHPLTIIQGFTGFTLNQHTGFSKVHPQPKYRVLQGLPLTILLGAL